MKLLSPTPTLSIQGNTSKPINIHNHSTANSHFSLLIPISHFKNCKLIKTKTNKGWRLKEAYFVLWKLKKSAKCFLWSCSERLFHKRIGGGKKRKREDIYENVKILKIYHNKLIYITTNILLVHNKLKIKYITIAVVWTSKEN